jgi:hypothetical protein
MLPTFKKEPSQPPAVTVEPIDQSDHLSCFMVMLCFIVKQAISTTIDTVNVQTI